MSLPVAATSEQVLPVGARSNDAQKPGRWWPRRPERTIIERRGALAPLLLPIGIASALIIVGVPSIAIWNIYSASESRRALHEAALNPDVTTVRAPVQRQVPENDATFVLRLIDGKLVRVVAAKDAVSGFINQTLAKLEQARAEARAQATAGLDQLFVQAFATRQSDLAAYADWFFAWGRSWRFMYEAVAGAVQEAVRLSFSQTQITDAARHAVEAYLLRHYQDIVLKPGLRDQMITNGIDAVLRNAHERYLAAVAGLDDDMQRFLSEKTHNAEEIAPGSVALKIDWDAEKWKAPRYSAEDRYLEPVGSVALIGGSAMLGSVLARVVVPFFARTTAQVLASSEVTLGGATVGSIEPGLGTAIGALVGAAIDWGISRFRDYMERDDFIADNSAALDASVTTWKAHIAPEINRAIDVWFDDTRATVAQSAPAR